MRIIISLICSFLFFKSVFTNFEADYYWRDYTGIIPEDAVPGGLDVTGNATYIAQMYVEKNGILPARIYKGKREVTSSRYGLHTSSQFVKVLCSGHIENFKWVPVSAKELHLQTISKHLVQGGTENDRIVNIGRVRYQGELIVGKVCGYVIDVDYYWRDYIGEIPKDAVPGGLDINGKTTYIAQMHVAREGLIPTRIYQKKREVTSSRCGIHTSTQFIKILCSGHLENLKWVPATAEKLHLQTISKQLVQGGHESGRILHIGRIQYQGELIVGKVCGYNIGFALLYFPYNNREYDVGSYEVLTYQKENLVDQFNVRCALPATNYKKN